MINSCNWLYATYLFEGSSDYNTNQLRLSQACMAFFEIKLDFSEVFLLGNNIIYILF